MSFRRRRLLCTLGVPLLLCGAVLLAGAVPAAGAAPVSVPGQLINLSGWSLTLPVAAPGGVNALTVGPAALPAYSLPPYFTVNAAHTAVLLRANTTGAVVAGGTLARSELREVSASGSAAAWTSASSSTLTTRQAVMHLPSASPVSVPAEVHAGSTDLLQIVADGRGRPTGTATLCVRFGGVQQASCLDNNYILGKAYDLSIKVSAGTITVSYNNVVKLTLAYTGTGMSFRVGAYLQTNKGTDANAYGETAVYRLGVSHVATTRTRWTPKPGVQWQWQLGSTPTAAQLAKAYAAGARAFDIDGDGAGAATVAAIHALGTGVGAVCYIDVGGWEDYRSDAANFPASVKGSAIDGWPSEKWLDVRQLAVLEPLMQARVQMCASKGFDAVEPDLLDGFENSTGFPITAAQQIAYNTMIAGLAHAAGLTVAQKGDVDQAAALQPVFDWTLNEQCGEYNECGALSAYTAAGKAVWIVEYSGYPKVCAIDFPVAGAAAMYKSLDLTADPRTPCLSSAG